MRVTVQDSKTFLFLRADLRWTDKPEEAKQFRNGVEAFGFIRRHSISDAQLVYDIPDKLDGFLVPAFEDDGPG